MGLFLDDELIESVLSDADDALSADVHDGGEMSFDAPAHIATARV